MGASDILQATPLASFLGHNSSAADYINAKSRSWPLSLLPSTADRVPFSSRHFYTEVAPVLLGFFALTVLVQIPNTRTLRLGIMSVVLTLAYHVSTTCDIAVNLGGGRMSYTNFGFCAGMICLGMRVVDFGIASTPYVRIEYSARNPKASQDPTADPWGLIVDAFDLCFNERGVGWNWGKSTYLPPRAKTSALHFAATSFITAIQMFTLADFIVFAQQSFILQPSTRPTIAPYGSIIDPTFAPLARYGKAALMTFLYTLQLSCNFQAGYSLGAVLGMTVFRQQPEQWPPLFDQPWLTQSVTEFWGKRWQQVFKRSFVICGAKPIGARLGRTAGVVGAFLVSGLMHDLGMWGLGQGAEPMYMTLGFVMMGFGCLVEAAWERYTRMKVGGFLGWAWSMIWLMTTAIPITDALARRGFFESATNPGDFRPAVLWIDVVKRWQSLHPA
ncbi:hypothetical protein EVG20_g8619 [Dentipellis fragilis]|uniref:Wax synthase domain-containing protein n=1 Tax=Dentipellis fragilis TaxID=205917 RepID=A0A4Y9Y627_9AGAM|nr:hypothetical protein EVG20_g8619 [Dentipellis fragilis]